MLKIAKICAVWLVLMASAATIFAYDFQYADDEKRIPMRWRTGIINLAVSNSLKISPNIRPNSDISGALKRSIAHWESEANVKFLVSWTDKQAISGEKGDGVNLITIAQTPENLTIFAQDGSEIAGNTRSFYTRRGEIVESDIALSPFQEFSTDGSFDTFDLEAVLTHEIGHLLGLDHSGLMSATMAANQGKNGVYGLPDFTPRTLAEDDKTAIRALYGAKIENENCCGIVAGKVFGSDSRFFNVKIWAEEITGGKVAAVVSARKDGSFQIGGLMAGKYRFLAVPETSETNHFRAEEIGEITIENGKTAILNHHLKPLKTDFSLNRIGFNAQLSTIAVSINKEKTYQIYVSGANLAKIEPSKVTIDSPYFSINPKTVRKEDFETDEDVLSFEVSVAPNAPKGEYSLRVQTPEGEILYLIGALTIEDFPNNFQSHIFFDEE